MKKVLYSVVAIAAISLASCGGGDSWNDSNKEAFVKECTDGGLGEKSCQCMADKLAEKYSSVSEAKKAMEDDAEVAQGIVMECL